MRFSEKEIVFLTSVSRGRLPFGVTYEIPPVSERKNYVEETIRSLKKKAILDEAGQLTREGAEILHLWEQYRNSKRHIRLNHLNVAILAKGMLFIVIQMEDSYELGCIHSALVMTELLKNAEYLCRDEQVPIRGKWEKIENGTWSEDKEVVDGCILLYEYDTGILMQEKVYYWKGQSGYLYHKTRQRIRELSPAVMRKQIYRILEGSE